MFYKGLGYNAGELPCLFKLTSLANALIPFFHSLQLRVDQDFSPMAVSYDTKIKIKNELDAL